jgi:hypothetical protein
VSLGGEAHDGEAQAEAARSVPVAQRIAPRVRLRHGLAFAILNPGTVVDPVDDDPSALGRREANGRSGADFDGVSMRFATARPMIEISLYRLADGFVRNESGEQARAGDGRAQIVPERLRDT